MIWIIVLVVANHIFLLERTIDILVPGIEFHSLQKEPFGKTHFIAQHHRFGLFLAEQTCRTEFSVFDQYHHHGKQTYQPKQGHFTISVHKSHCDLSVTAVRAVSLQFNISFDRIDGVFSPLFVASPLRFDCLFVSVVQTNNRSVFVCLFFLFFTTQINYFNELPLSMTTLCFL